MNNRTQKIVRILLYPFGWIYSLVVAFRNHLFDRQMIKSCSFRTATIVVGNITVGGTGKTPMVEYLIRLLKDTYNLVELSRGYGRKTRGYVEATQGVNASTIGDEAYQIHRKYPEVRVVADADRCHAIQTIENNYPETDAILLDDAYQHRYLSAGKTILLIDYTRPIMEDKILPYGNLRESVSTRLRADIVVVTKCPPQMTAFNAREVKNSLELHAYQDLFFATIKYTVPQRLTDRNPLDTLEGKSVLLVTAIAHPGPLVEYLDGVCSNVNKMLFEDHHRYVMDDINRITRTFDDMESDSKCIIVTPKDEAKLVALDIPDYIMNRIYILDVEIDFLFDGKADFDKKITDYVEKNKRNSVLFTK